MKVKIDVKMYDSDGKEVANPGKPSLTLRDVIVNSILTYKEGEGKKEKYEKYSLFKRLKDAKSEIDFTVEEIVLIKECIGQFQAQLIMGQCFDLLDK